MVIKNGFDESTKTEQLVRRNKKKQRNCRLCSSDLVCHVFFMNVIQSSTVMVSITARVELPGTEGTRTKGKFPCSNQSGLVVVQR